MITEIIMLLILGFLAFLILFRDSKGRSSSFLDPEASGCMRGFWCLIVLLVHIPAEHQNTIQDAIGSFAFVGVTFFFMMSSYGLTLSALKKPDTYLKGFWSRRLLRLMLPMLFVNVFTVAAEYVTLGKFNPWQLISLTNWVRQILIFYLLFWLVHSLFAKYSVKVKNNILIIITLMLSVIIYFTGGFGVMGWPTETMGFVYGILLASQKERFNQFALKKWWIKALGAFVLSAVTGVAYLKFKEIPLAGDYLLKILLGIAILLLIFIFNAKVSIGNPVSRFLGSISYEVYLFHSVAFIVLDGISVKLSSGVYIISSLIITVLLSFAVNRICAVITRKR